LHHFYQHPAQCPLVIAPYADFNHIWKYLHECYRRYLSRTSQRAAGARQTGFAGCVFGLVSPSDPAVEQAWIAECEQRAAAIDCGEMPLVGADEVMLKYRQ
jgi:hypothetical protein